MSAAIICTLAVTGFSLAPSYGAALLFRSLMGLGASCGFICLVVAIYDWMPRNRIATFIGLSQFIATLGPMLAAGPIDSLSEISTVSWREVFGYLGAFGCILTLLVLFFVDQNKQHKTKTITLTRPNSSSRYREFFLQKQVWCIAITCACLMFGLEYLSENECKIFLIHKGFSTTFASYMISVGWIGFAIGCAMLGAISDKIQRRKILMLCCALTILIALTGIIYLPLNKTFTSICFLFLGVGASGQSIGFAIMAEQCRVQHVALGIGLNNAMIVLFTAVLPPIIGFLLPQTHVQLLSPLSQYQYAFFILIILALTAVTLTGFVLQETFCKSRRENTLLTRPKYT